MPVQHVKPSALVKKYGYVFCFDCGTEAEDASEDALWTIWTPTMYYCPRCAKREGIGPHDY